MRYISVPLVCFLAVVLPYLPALADSEPDPRIAPAYLIKAEKFGTWKQGTQSGFLRYSIYEGGIEEVENILVVDWIAVDEESGAQTVAATVEITPIPGVFAAPRISPEAPYVLHMEINTNLCEEKQQYDVKLTSMGKYQLRYLNKKACDPVGTGN